VKATVRAAGWRWRQEGFSLLEVVVAFAILALTLGVLMQIFSRALSTTAISGEYSRAATLAEARLNAVGTDLIPLEEGTYGGDPEEGITWQVFIDPYEQGEVTWEPSLDAYVVTAVASWGGDRDETRRQLSLTTLRLAPPSDLSGALPGPAAAPPEPEQPAGGAPGR
jgi:general secretion pathway protein I